MSEEASMRLTVRDVQRMRGQGERSAMVTAYDYTSAQLVERAGLPAILVGDTLGMVVLGNETTVPVTLDDMLRHCQAVARGSRRALLIGDLPFLTYPHPEASLRNAGRLLQEGGMQAVKLEGGAAMAPVVRGLVGVGVPVMGHIGFTPQSVHTLGVRVQGCGGRARDGAWRRKGCDGRIALERAGLPADQIGVRYFGARLLCHLASDLHHLPETAPF
jgi:3-methyl-2-oxobutanoate hydroxymethyltransferase